MKFTVISCFIILLLSAMFAGCGILPQYQLEVTKLAPPNKHQLENEKCLLWPIGLFGFSIQEELRQDAPATKYEAST